MLWRPFSPVKPIVLMRRSRATSNTLRILEETAARADSCQDVTRFPKGFHLAREGEFEGRIIPDGRQDGCIDCQRDGWQGRPVQAETVDELGHHVLRIGRAAAVATQHELIPIAEALHQTVADIVNHR